MNKIMKIITGGWLVGRRTYIISGAGIIAAVAAYVAGDANIFETLQTVFTLGGIYFLRRGITNESSKENKCKSQKNSKTRTAA
ncbi:MAG: hypothetical protein FWC51_01650 [Proteobacteria bacterium]|nr:hypothetical protein [Pseudomonadota bacterium]